MSDKVYVLDIRGEDGEGDTLDEHLSIHATDKSAKWRLFDWIHQIFGIDPRGDDVQVIATYTLRGPVEPGTSVDAADLQLPDGTFIQYAITPYAVEELGK